MLCRTWTAKIFGNQSDLLVTSLLVLASLKLVTQPRTLGQIIIVFCSLVLLGTFMGCACVWIYEFFIDRISSGTLCPNTVFLLCILSSYTSQTAPCTQLISSLQTYQTIIVWLDGWALTIHWVFVFRLFYSSSRFLEMPDWVRKMVRFHRFLVGGDSCVLTEFLWLPKILLIPVRFVPAVLLT